MTFFTIGTIASVRLLRKRRATMAEMVSLLREHTRDEIVEAIDATVRHQSNHDAAAWANRAIAAQAAGIQCINGRPQSRVRRPDPMF